MRARGIIKRYPGTTALKGVDFEVWPGRVNVLVGENGAGKSTLMKILAGIERPESGTTELEGREIRFRDAREAAAAGVGIIHQELSIFPDMRVADNMFAGREIHRHGIIDRKTQNRRAREALALLRQDIDPEERMRDLRVGRQQTVEIAGTMLQRQLRVLIMDEPTSSLSDAEVEVLFELIGDLKRRGIALIYISHRLEEIIRIGDYITVLRDGRRVADAEIKDITVSWIVRKMVGHESLTVDRSSYSYKSEDGAEGDGRAEADVPARDVLLRVKDYSLPRPGGGFAVDHVSFELRRGEVLGIYGLMGAGRTELLESLLGLHPEAGGTLVVDGETVEKPSVAEQIERGIVLVPEDRQKDGLVQTMSIAKNLLLSSIPRHAGRGVIDENACRRSVAEAVADMRIRAADVKHAVTVLSGGNQQKVVIGRCILARPKIFMMDEPSRGIDVGAKTDIFNLMRRFASQGMGVIFAGSELREIMSVCDRVLVMSSGMLTGNFSGDEITEEALVSAAAAALKTGLKTET